MWLQVALNLGAFTQTQIFLKIDFFFFLCSLALILHSNMFSEPQMTFEGSGFFLKLWLRYI